MRELFFAVDFRFILLLRQTVLELALRIAHAKRQRIRFQPGWHLELEIEQAQRGFIHARGEKR